MPDETQIVCSDCGEERPHYAKGLCGTCYHRRWRKENPDKVAANQHRWQERHREERAVYACRYNQEHQEENNARMRRYQQEHREEHLAYQHRYRQANPDRVAINDARRKARKKALPDTLTLGQAEQLYTIGRAVYPGEKLHLDHIIPLSKGGGTTLANMHAIPASLNCAKNDKLPEKIYKQGILL